MYGAELPRGVTKTDRKIAAMVLATKIVVSFIFRSIEAEIDSTVVLYIQLFYLPSYILYKPTDSNINKSSFQITWKASITAQNVPISYSTNWGRHSSTTNHHCILQPCPRQSHSTLLNNSASLTCHESYLQHYISASFVAFSELVIELHIP
jgi:hypothetical protein